MLFLENPLQLSQQRVCLFMRDLGTPCTAICCKRATRYSFGPRSHHTHCSVSSCFEIHTHTRPRGRGRCLVFWRTLPSCHTKKGRVFAHASQVARVSCPRLRFGSQVKSSQVKSSQFKSQESRGVFLLYRYDALLGRAGGVGGAAARHKCAPKFCQVWTDVDEKVD